MKLGVILSACLFVCATAAQAKPPVVVELYTSQGCGACAEATGLVDALAGRDDLLALTFSVDYWDYLGWTDTFARPEFSERQRRYAERWSTAALYTPQVVVAGRGQTSAGQTEVVEQLIEEAAARAAPPPRIAVKEDKVTISAGVSGQTVEVWLIRYDPRGQDVRVRRGENQGRTLTYRNVVRELVLLGEWNGQAVVFDLPGADREGLSTLVMLQAPDGGEILALHTG